MTRSGPVVLLAMFAACAAASAPGPRSWLECRCDWLEAETRALAGPGLVDCGFVNLLEDDSRQELREGMRCAREAFRKSVPFRYGSLRIPHDSYAREILIRSSDGTLWLVTHDVMIDGDAPQVWKQRCKDLRFKSRNSGFVISGCETGEETAR